MATATRIFALFGIVSFALAALTGAAHAGQEVGFISDVTGSVNIQPAEQSDWQPAAIDNAVSLGDSISTGPDSRVEILLVDDTTLTLAGDTEMVIDRMIVGDLATQERSILKQLRGQVRANVGKAFGGTTRIEIHTPTAVAGVKGSTMEILVRDETTACNVEGSMFVRNIDDAVGGEIDIPVGMCSRVNAGAPPEAPEIYPRDFPVITAPSRTRVAATTIDALIGTSAGVGAAAPQAAPAESLGQVSLSGLDTTTRALGEAPPEPTFDGGVESIPTSTLDQLPTTSVGAVSALPNPSDIPVVILEPGDPR